MWARGAAGFGAGMGVGVGSRVWARGLEAGVADGLAAADAGPGWPGCADARGGGGA